MGWSAEVLAKFGRKKGDWQCHVCNTINRDAKRIKCISCGAERQGYKSTVSADAKTTTSGTSFNFGGGDTTSQNSGAFTFGGSAQIQNNGNSTAGFTFGSTDATTTATTGGFSFDSSANVTTTASSGGFTLGAGGTMSFGGSSVVFNAATTSTDKKENEASNVTKKRSFDVDFVLPSAVPRSKKRRKVDKKQIDSSNNASECSPSEVTTKMKKTNDEKFVDLGAAVHSGSVYSWGSGDCDQLGHGKSLHEDGSMAELTPRQVLTSYFDKNDSKIAYVAAGGLHVRFHHQFFFFF